MSITDVEGIITKETKYGDSSRIITVITKELGKISILAGNVRRGKHGLLNATSLFSHSKFIIFKGGSSSLYKLNDAELITSFSSIKESLEAMAFASYLCDIENSVIPENSPEEAQYLLLLRSLYLLAKPNVNFEKIKAVFEFRTLYINGLMPDLTHCGDCGSNTKLTELNIFDGALYCTNCSENHQNSYKINDSILSALSYIVVSEETKVFSFNMSETAINYLSSLGEKSIEVLLDKRFKTLDYLRNVTSL